PQGLLQTGEVFGLLVAGARFELWKRPLTFEFLLTYVHCVAWGLPHWSGWFRAPRGPIRQPGKRSATLAVAVSCGGEIPRPQSGCKGDRHYRSVSKRSPRSVKFGRKPVSAPPPRRAWHVPP